MQCSLVIDGEGTNLVSLKTTNIAVFFRFELDEPRLSASGLSFERPPILMNRLDL